MHVGYEYFRAVISQGYSLLLLESHLPRKAILCKNIMKIRAIEYLTFGQIGLLFQMILVIQ